MMKKYILGVFFFLGILFVSLVSNGDVVSADTNVTVTTDSYDSRKITIDLIVSSGRTNHLIINEVVPCQEGEKDCNVYTIAGNPKYLKIIEGTEKKQDVEVDETTLATSLEYNIVSEGDGTKYFYIAAYEKTALGALNLLVSSSCYFEHQLSTLTQRIIINPDKDGESTFVFDHIQYSAVRKISISVGLYDEEYETYTGDVYVCEVLGEDVVHCGDYVVNDTPIEYYLSSYGDGQKYLNIYLVKSGNSIGDTNNIVQELKDEAVLVSKDIYLDTIGPEITVKGGNWVFVASGERYVEQEATCKDAVFATDECFATNDYSVVGINYNDSKYQIITYEATDRLGNVTNIPVKVKVNQEVKDNSLIVGLIVGGSIMVLTCAILTYVVLKNHEKKKKMSYI